MAVPLPVPPIPLECIPSHVFNDSGDDHRFSQHLLTYSRRTTHDHDHPLVSFDDVGVLDDIIVEELLISM